MEVVMGVSSALSNQAAQGPKRSERSVARVSSLLVATGRKVRQINRSRWSYRNQVSRIAQTALRGRRSGVDRRVDGEEEEW